MTDPKLLTTRESETPADNSPELHHRSRGFLWFALIVNLLLVLGLGGVGGWWWLNQYQPDVQAFNSRIDSVQSMDPLVQSIQANRQSLNSIADQQLNFTEQLDGLRRAANQSEQQTSQRFIAVQDRISGIASKSEQTPEKWQAIESLYLLRLANRKLHVEHDYEAAERLLEEVAVILANTNDPALFSAKEIVAQDIQVVSQTRPEPIEDILVTTSTLLVSADKLTLKGLQIPARDHKVKTDVSEDPADWKQNLKNVWSSVVANFIVTTRRDTAVEPLLTLQQATIIIEQLKLNIMQAQFAAHQHKNDVYHAALEQIASILKEHFQANHPVFKQFESSLQTLKSRSVARSNPQTLASLMVLEEQVQP